MKKLLLFEFITIVSIYNIHAINVLVLEEVISPSHHYFIKRLLLALVDKGHNVTSLTAENVIETVPHLHYLYLDLVYERLHNASEEFDFLSLGELKPWKITMKFYDYGIAECEAAVKSIGWKQLLNYPNDFKFDLVIHDFLCGPCQLAFLHKFKYPPLISLTAFNDLSFTTEFFGTILAPSISPQPNAKYISTTFFYRVNNFVLQTYDNYIHKTHNLGKFQEVVSPQFPNLPDLREIQRKTQLIMLNNDPAVDLPDSFPPNIIKIGGLQIMEPR